jgi:hypothetical protein
MIFHFCKQQEFEIPLKCMRQNAFGLFSDTVYIKFRVIS